MWILVGLEWQLYPSCLQWGISSWRSPNDSILASQRLSSTRIKAGVGRVFTFEGLCSPDQEVGRDKVCRRHFPRPVKILDVLPHQPRFSQSEFTNINSILNKFWSLFSFFCLKKVKIKASLCSEQKILDEILGLKRVLWRPFVGNAISRGEHAGDGDFEERDQGLPVFSKQGILAMSGMMLWRQQVCAVMRIRLLRLKHEGKFLRSV